MRKPPLSMISAVVASLLSRSSRSSPSSCSMSSSISWGRLAISCVLRSCLADEFVQQHASDHVEGLKDAFALVRGGAEGGNLEVAVIQEELHVFHWGSIGQVALVILQNVGDVGEIEFQGLEVVFEVGEALDVLGHLFVLGIGDKDNAVHADIPYVLQYN